MQFDVKLSETSMNWEFKLKLFDPVAHVLMFDNGRFRKLWALDTSSGSATEQVGCFPPKACLVNFDILLQCSSNVAKLSISVRTSRAILLPYRCQRSHHCGHFDLRSSWKPGYKDYLCFVNFDILQQQHLGRIINFCLSVQGKLFVDVQMSTITKQAEVRKQLLIVIGGPWLGKTGGVTVL